MSVHWIFRYQSQEKCPVNIIYGGQFKNDGNGVRPEAKTFIDCLKLCRDTASCYSTNFDVTTSRCYLNPDNSTSAYITITSNNWISTEVDRYKFDNDPNILSDLNGLGCDVKFLYFLHFIQERRNDATERGARFSKRQNTFGDIKLKTVTPTGSFYDCAIKCITSPECLGIKYELFCQMAVKY
uniref:Apple domain-containing protein n=1 Tax=Octopus bimaculoides TaxID=37653 RepID=A0A0L8HWB9_OCTBM